MLPTHQNRNTVWSDPWIQYLRRQPLGSARVKRCEMHAGKVEVECNNAVETDAATTVGRDAGLAEDIDAV